MALDIVGQLFIDGAWSTRAGFSERGGWTFETGPTEETGYRSTKIGITWANDDLELDPSNVQSTLYGKIGRNTRTRLRINNLTLTQAEASQWEPETTVEHVPLGPGQPSARGTAWVGMTAEGLFRRLGKWTDTLQSPMSRYITAAPSLIGWLGMEEPAGATRLSQGVSGARRPTVTGVVSFGEDAPLGALSSMKLGTGGYVDMPMKTTGSAGNWTFTVAVNLAVVPVSGIGFPVFTLWDSGARTWDFNFNSSGITLNITTFGGGVVHNFIYAYGTLPNRWTWYTITVTTSGSTVNVNIASYAQNDSVGYFIGTSFTSAFGAGKLDRMVLAQNSANLDALYCHATGQSIQSTYLQGLNANQIFNAYPGERVGYRFVRLMQEQGLQPYVSGDLNKTVPMGPQRTGTLLDLLSECMITEGGLLYDEPQDIALTLRTREFLSSKTPSLALTSSQARYPLRKIIDDSGLANLVNISNSDGSKGLASLDSGAISTQPPPNGIGLVKFDLDVNMLDADALDDRAGFELAKRTIDRPRYRQLKVDLFANPSLADTVTLMRPGDWISVTGIEPDPIFLRAISWTRTGDAVRDEVTFTCLPAEPMQIAVIDGAGQLLTSGSTSLNAGITSTATTIVLKTVVPQDCWATAGGYDITVAGELVGVPAAGMGAVTGTGPFLQTITGAVRSKNGVVKAQLADAKVDVYQPVRIGLG